MISTRKITLLTLTAAVLATVGAAAQAQQWVATATKAPRLVSTDKVATTQAAVVNATHIAALQAGAQVQVVVALKLRNKADLDNVGAQVMAGRARPLAPEAFKQTYAPTDAQVKAVTDYLSKQGFVHISVSDNKLFVTADGTAGAVKGAFNTELHTYNVDGRTAFGNASDVSVPAALGDIVLAVHGLQDIHMAHTMAKPLAHTLAATGHNPTDFPLIYNAASLPSATNAIIGIITQGSMTGTITDLKSFASKAGYPVPNVTTVTVGSASSDTSGIDEWNMDTQDSLAAAGGTIKQMILYTATTLSDANLTSTYNRAVTDNVAKVINVSLGECETDAKNSGIMASNDQIFQTAAAQGQTFSVSSGDSGAYECGGSTTSQSYPSVSPYVISVGGTLLNTSGTTWTSETVWACTSSSTCQQSASGGAGGGPSLTESAPSWQTAAGVLGSSTKRGTPDIAFDASPNSGALVLVNGTTEQIGGTSLAAPLFTGFWARVQSANGNALGFPASAIYQKAAANPSMFHDVTSGSNGGYSARTGWDYASGYGSLNVANFASVIGSGGGSTTPSNVLTSGVPVSGISLATGASKVFTISVPSGRSSLTIKTSGGSGDADLYVKLGSAPTTSSYLKASTGSTTAETITISAPAAGTYYIMVYGYAAPSGVTLVATD